MKINKENVAKLQEWIVNPTDDLNKYLEIIKPLTLSDLLFLMTSTDKSTATVAWAEYGRRRNLTDITISLVQVGQRIELKYDGHAVPLAHGVTLDG